MIDVDKITLADLGFEDGRRGAIHCRCDSDGWVAEHDAYSAVEVGRSPYMAIFQLLAQIAKSGRPMDHEISDLLDAMDKAREDVYRANAEAGHRGTWCPQCGSSVRVDEDGCCLACGSTAVGKGADIALANADTITQSPEDYGFAPMPGDGWEAGGVVLLRSEVWTWVAQSGHTFGCGDTIPAALLDLIFQLTQAIEEVTR